MRRSPEWRDRKARKAQSFKVNFKRVQYDTWPRVVSLNNRAPVNADKHGDSKLRALTYRDYTHPVVVVEKGNEFNALSRDMDDL